MFPPKSFDNFSPKGGGLDAFIFFFEPAVSKYWRYVSYYMVQKKGGEILCDLFKEKSERT